ncbi:MAG: tRNA (guanosine(37)-N1)-methyltransferase TrmD [Gammaproteobacteria bacterium]
MKFSIITLFPDMFEPLKVGITGRALKTQKIALDLYNPRDYADNRHRTVDDAPYGGGPGMVMMAAPLSRAILAAKEALPSAKVIYCSPQGKVFDQALAQDQTKRDQPLIFIAGRYEGIDQRVIDLHVDEEWSLGDYILSGGELAAMVMIDAISRLIPGVLGDEQSAEIDSLSDGLLKYPQYTRPETFEGHSVPSVLLSGDHKAIAAWRKKQSLLQTHLKRPDLLEKIALTDKQRVLKTKK